MDILPGLTIASVEAFVWDRVLSCKSLKRNNKDYVAWQLQMSAVRNKDGKNYNGEAMKSHYLVKALLSLVMGVTGLYLALTGSSCMPEMGAIDNEEQVGRQERGRDPGSFWVQDRDESGNPMDWTYSLFYQDIILSPDGNTLLAMVPVPGPNKGFDEPGMILAIQRLPLGTPVFLPHIADIIRLNFSPDGSRAYAMEKDGLTVHEIDLKTFQVVQSLVSPAPFSVIDVTPDGKHLILSNLPTSDVEEQWYGGGHNECAPCNPQDLPAGASLCEFAFVDVNSGESVLNTVTWRIRDIDFVPDRQEILVTYSNFIGGLPHAYIDFFGVEDESPIAKLSFPNCSDEVVIDAQRNLALLAPVDCVKDPISVIDLDTREFITNLPGFGPVVVSQDSSVAVGFTVKSVLEEEWDYHEQTTMYGLIFVNLDTLEYQITDYGDVAPAYTLSPDGKRLYIYQDSFEWKKDADGHFYKDYNGGGLHELVLETKEWNKLTPPEIRLDRFVWSADGKTMYFLSGTKLFKLDVEASQVTPIALMVSPELMNLRPQQDYLLLGENDSPDFYLLDLENNFKPIDTCLEYRVR